MTDHLAEAKRLMWKSRTSRSEFWRDYYKRSAEHLIRQYEQLQKENSK